MKKKILLVLVLFMGITSINSQTLINSLVEFRTAVQNSDQQIILSPGDYNWEDLPNGDRIIEFSGSNNTITLTGVYIEVPVGIVNVDYLHISGDNNTIIDGEIEDVYSGGVTEITDFTAYNEDRDNLAYGLSGNPVIRISGQGNLVDGIKLTVRGSFPYGYGSLFGIGGGNTFGLNKRCGIFANGALNTIDNVEVQMQAFGHGIFFQEGAVSSLVKNSLVEGVLRPSNDILAEGPNSLPGRNGYNDNEGNPIEPNEMVPLCEDGIRMYGSSGDITIENCTVLKMRGGIKLIFGDQANVSNSTSIDCGDVNWNMNANGIITNSIGNFTYGQLCDFPYGRSGYQAEWTILPSPNSIGAHNIMTVIGNDHELLYHRVDGPLDSDEKRAIVVEGSNSTIVNETEYTIILEAGTSGNDVTSCGTVIDNGSNTINRLDCDFVITCNNTTDNLEAECYDNMSGIAVEEINSNNDAVAYIENGDWISFNAIDLSKQGIVTATVGSPEDGTSIEVRAGSITGTLLGTITVPNTSGYGNYQEVSVELDQSFDGVTDLYFVFTGDAGYLFNVDEIRFEENPCTEILDPTIPIQLEDYCEALGVGLAYLVNDNQEADNINDGDYLKIANINFDLLDFNSINFLASSNTEGGTVEFRLGAIDGELLSSIEITNTGGWDQYEMFDNYTFTEVSGTQDLFVVFKGNNGYLFNADYLYFRTNSCQYIVDAYSQTEAIEYCEAYEVVPINDEYLGGIQDGDWIRFGSVDFGSISPSTVTLNLSGLSTTDGVVSILLNDPTEGTLIATATVPATDGWENWQEVVVSVDETVTGIQDVYVYFGGTSYNLDWFQFYKDSSLSNDEFEYNINKASIYPNPIVSTATITGAVDSIINIYDLNGKTLLTKEIVRDNEELDLSSFSTGIYYAQVNGSQNISFLKIVKK